MTPKNDKILKVKDLGIEIGRMWNFNITTIPVATGALGMFKKTTDAPIKKNQGNLSQS